MDVAKRFVDWTEHPPEQWLTTINRYLPPAVTAVLVLTIAYQLAGITWLLVPSAPQTAAPVARPSGQKPAAATEDLGQLKSSHLFGEAQQGSGAGGHERRRCPRDDAEPHADGHPRRWQHAAGDHLGQPQPGEDLPHRRHHR